METTLTIDQIVQNPKVRGGQPIIRGTSIRVADVAIAAVFHDQDADGISSWYGLSLSQVYAALSYYYEHKAEIDEAIKRQIDEAQELRKNRVGSRPDKSG